MNEKRDIRSLSLEQLSEAIKPFGVPKYRAGQIYQWLHQKGVTKFEEMTNISLAQRKQLSECFDLVTLVPVSVLVSAIDGTRKYLFALPDGNVIESVWMKYQHGNSVCISSQVGCRMGCRFCASTLDGMVRSLRPSEMLEQIYRIQADTGERVSHVVIMGSGEPFDNYENVTAFLRMLSDPNGICISARNITLSTCGLVPEMERFAQEGLAVTLALSLHAPNDALRQTLMPVAKRYALADVLNACWNYFEKTGRRVSFEYSLIDSVNDSEKEARELAALLKGRHSHVNLIPVNPVEEREYRQSGTKKIETFRKTLEKNGINVTIRREMGRDIHGACGQLRKRYLQENTVQKSDCVEEAKT